MGYHKCCNKQKVKKGLWSPEEDEKLIKCISIFGLSCWSTIPKLAGLQRCGKSCRLRWINYLRPDLKRGNFSPREVALIIDLHKILGNRWSQISSYLPGRTDNEVKNFWNSTIKKKFLDHTTSKTNNTMPKYNFHVKSTILMDDIIGTSTLLFPSLNNIPNINPNFPIATPQHYQHPKNIHIKNCRQKILTSQSFDDNNNELISHHLSTPQNDGSLLLSSTNYYDPTWPMNVQYFLSEELMTYDHQHQHFTSDLEQPYDHNDGMMTTKKSLLMGVPMINSSFHSMEECSTMPLPSLLLCDDVHHSNVEVSNNFVVPSSSLEYVDNVEDDHTIIVPSLPSSHGLKQQEEDAPGFTMW